MQMREYDNALSCFKKIEEITVHSAEILPGESRVSFFASMNICMAICYIAKKDLNQAEICLKQNYTESSIEKYVII